VKEKQAEEKGTTKKPWDVSAVSSILTHSAPRERNLCIKGCKSKNCVRISKFKNGQSQLHETILTWLEEEDG
jgi:hypothetical protein